MRRLILLLTVVAAILSIPTAQAVRAPEVSLSVSSFQVRYGDSIQLAGVVSTRKAGVAVGIFARPFTASGFTRVSTVTTGAGGRWAFEVKPGIATTYQARTGGNESRVLLVGVRPAVSLEQLAGNGRLRVDVAAASSFAGRSVKLQQLDSEGWSTLTSLRLNANSRALVPASFIPLGRSTLRVTMSVNQAGSGYLGGFSRPMILPARWVSLSLSSFEIVYGRPVQLSGRVGSKQAGIPLTLLARPMTKPEFQPLAKLTTGPGGRWSYVVKPRTGTAYEAQFGRATSRVAAVGVHPAVKAKIVSNGRVKTQVVAGTSLEGRSVKLQQLTDGQWRTVAKRSLDGRSQAVFPAAALPGGTSTLRIAMSVNQAGTGYLGAFSKAFVYQR